MVQMLKEIFEYRDLAWMLTLRDLRVRYKQAAMGFLWAVFMPIVAVCAGILIKQAMAVVSHQSLNIRGIMSISVRVLPWTFFISSIRFSVQALVGNTSLITKIYFPRAILVLSSILACLFDFAIGSGVLVVLLTIFNVGLSLTLLWLPLLLLLLVLFTTGLGLILSCANLFYRDVKYIVEVILMYGIFFTPVFYDANTFGRLKPFMLLNPIGSILEGINQVVVIHLAPDKFWTTYAALISVSIFILGMSIFHKNEHLFAENI